MALLGDLYYHGDALAGYRQHANNWSKIAFKTADWQHVYGSCFLPILASFEKAESLGQPVDPNLRRKGLDAAGRVAWMVLQRASKAGVSTDEALFRREIGKLCPDFDFSVNLTGEVGVSISCLALWSSS